MWNAAAWMDAEWLQSSSERIKKIQPIVSPLPKPPLPFSCHIHPLFIPFLLLQGAPDTGFTARIRGASLEKEANLFVLFPLLSLVSAQQAAQQRG